MSIDVKSPQSNEKKIAVSEFMKETLADLFVFYTKARNYHWNVTGPMFFTLHAEFEAIYEELADDIDAIAERIRALGSKAPGTMKEFMEISSIQEEPGVYPKYSKMVDIIIGDFETIIKQMNGVAKKLQEGAGDEVSAGLYYSLIEKYQKKVWMLKSLQD